MLLSNLRNKFYLVIVLCALMLSQAVPAMAHSMESKAPMAPSIQLGVTYDKCSAQLYVWNTSHVWQPIQRGVWTTVYVQVDSNGFWQWRCGMTKERSRSSVLPFQVHRVDVLHSLLSRDIKWKIFS